MAKREIKLNELGIEPRNLTPEQVRELFLKKKKELSKDWRVLKSNVDDNFMEFNILAYDYMMRLYGMVGDGTVYHIHGDEGSGKSTVAYAINMAYQKANPDLPVVIFDFERTTKSYYLRAMGFDEDRAFIIRPDSVEDAIKQTIDFINQGIRLFTFDSIPRMRSKVDAADVKSGKVFSNQPGTHSRVMQQFYDIVLPYIAGVDGTLLMVNQVRSRIDMSQEGKNAAAGYATITNLNYNLPGGRANRYAAGVMVEQKVHKAWRPGKHADEWVLEPAASRGEEYLATEISCRSLKNKVSGTGYRSGTLWIRPGYGVDDNISVRELARHKDFQLIGNHGKRWYAGESIDNAIKVYNNKADGIQDLVIDNNPDVLEPLRALLITKLKANTGSFEIELDNDTQRYLAGEDNFATDQLEPHTPIAIADDDDI